MRTSIIISLLILVVSFFPLLGLPGAALVEASRPFIDAFYGAGSFDRMSVGLGDKAWPLALGLSTVVPVLIPLCHLGMRRLPIERALKIGVSVLLIAFVGVSVAGLALVIAAAGKAGGASTGRT